MLVLGSGAGLGRCDPHSPSYKAFGPCGPGLGGQRPRQEAGSHRQALGMAVVCGGGAVSGWLSPGGLLSLWLVVCWAFGWWSAGPLVGGLLGLVVCWGSLALAVSGGGLACLLPAACWGFSPGLCFFFVGHRVGNKRGNNKRQTTNRALQDRTGDTVAIPKGGFLTQWAGLVAHWLRLPLVCWGVSLVSCGVLPLPLARATPGCLWRSGCLLAACWVLLLAAPWGCPGVPSSGRPAPGCGGTAALVGCALGPSGSASPRFAFLPWLLRVRARRGKPQRVTVPLQPADPCGCLLRLVIGPALSAGL